MASHSAYLRDAHALAAGEAAKERLDTGRRHSFHAAIVVTRESTVWAVNVTTQDHRAFGHHAEMRAIQKVSPSSLVGATVYVARSQSGRWADSRPCASCDRKLRKMGVARVLYTTDEGIEATVTYRKM